MDETSAGQKIDKSNITGRQAGRRNVGEVNLKLGVDINNRFPLCLAIVQDCFRKFNAVTYNTELDSIPLTVLTVQLMI